jgi:hypothetical protein
MATDEAFTEITRRINAPKNGLTDRRCFCSIACLSRSRSLRAKTCGASPGQDRMNRLSIAAPKSSAPTLDEVLGELEGDRYRKRHRGPADSALLGLDPARGLDQLGKIGSTSDQDEAGSAVRSVRQLNKPPFLNQKHANACFSDGYR